MIKKNITYNPFNTRQSLRYWAAILLLFIVFTRSVIPVQLVMNDVIYELLDTSSEKENSPENKKLSDIEDESKYFYSANYKFEPYKNVQDSNFCIPQKIMNNEKDILVPPPKG